MAIALWPRGTGAGKCMHSFVGSELYFLKLGSDLVDFSEGVSIFFLKANIQGCPTLILEYFLP